MSADWTLAVLTAVGVAGTGFNVFLTILISRYVLGVKLWANETFVAKEDMPLHLAPLRETIQALSSHDRVRRTDARH